MMVDRQGRRGRIQAAVRCYWEGIWNRRGMTV
jgi:hypothetical protein